MRWLLCTVMILSLVGLAAASDEALPLADLCREAFEQEGFCPQHLCMEKCFAGLEYPGCETECVPRSCRDISLQDCPQPECQIIKGCDDKPQCFERVESHQSTCGTSGYIGDGLPCCEGFIKRCGFPSFDDTCERAPQNSYYSAPMCIPCGNGICETLENACNCPEDCAKSK